MLAVDLTHELAAYIEETARKIRAEAVSRKAANELGASSSDLHLDRMGVAGEVAARVILGLDPCAIPIFWRGRGLDVAGYEVRCRGRGNYMLYLKGTEPAAARVMLLTGEEYPDVIYFRRWGVIGDYFGSRFVEKPPGVRVGSALYFVPQSAMRLAETLPDLRPDWRESCRYINDNGLCYADEGFAYWRELADEHERRYRAKRRERNDAKANQDGGREREEADTEGT
jgi:hypothetical protein